MERQPAYSIDLSPQGIADLARYRWTDRKNKGYPVSREVAVGLVMREKGRDILRGEESTYINQAIGMIVLGTVLESLEEVILKNVWDDKIFIDRLGGGFSGTRVSAQTFYDFIRTGNDLGRIFLEETEHIRLTLRKEGSLLSFLNPENNGLLPRSIITVLDEDGGGLGIFLSLAVPMYKDAIGYL